MYTRRRVEPPFEPRWSFPKMPLVAAVGRRFDYKHERRARRGELGGARGAIAALRARAPYRLSLEDHIRVWSRIACPTLLVSGSESFLPDPATAGVMKHFDNAELARIEGAGHWLQHDKPDEVLDLLGKFLEQVESK